MGNFRQNFFGEQIRKSLIHQVFTYINKFRRNENIPKEEVARIINIYNDLDFNKVLELEYNHTNNSIFMKTDSEDPGNPKAYYIELFEKPY